MPTLAGELRNRLERVVVDARDAAEAGARAALEALAVHEPRFYPHMSRSQQALRNHLRARARQLGDRQDATGRLAIDHLVGECAYEHWHRMLFSRFLAENDLLIEPQESMAISLAEAEELATEEGVDVWVFASRCAQRMLPQIFRPDDPLLQVSFATEDRLRLEGLLTSLPQLVFTASDALGWVYQFWQSKRKDEVNRSEVKIGADELPAVTQLFTEPYMVSFLLHNTLGAWWASKQLTTEDMESSTAEDELRRKVALPGVSWEYLRFVRGDDGKGGPWRPAAGTFEGWPRAAAELKILDPCCGSGHFLVAALHHLVPIRMTEEGISARAAVDAVLRDNLRGLEVDERCCQIAAFALAFTAWTCPGAGGYRPLPELHIACTGVGPQASKAQWLDLAEKAAAKGNMPAKRDLFRREESLLSSTVANALESLYDLFAQAPTLGSLIDPRRLPRDLYRAGFESLAPLLSDVLGAEADDATRERAIAAAGMVNAAGILADKHTLVITNVPYLSKSKFDPVLLKHCETRFADARSNLAACCVQRSLDLASQNGSVAIVSMQTWLFQVSYTQFRRRLLRDTTLDFVAALGMKAFRTQLWDFATCLVVLSQATPLGEHAVHSLSVQDRTEPEGVPAQLRSASIQACTQDSQLRNPDSVWTLSDPRSSELLGRFAECVQGIKTGDDGRVRRFFWELRVRGEEWRFLQSTVGQTGHYGGMESLLYWGDEGQGLARKQGMRAWGRWGVAVSQMSDLPCAIYVGEAFDSNMAALMPRKPEHLAAILTYCFSGDFTPAVRSIDQALKPTNSSFQKIPFDFSYWQKARAERFPDGIPEPESDDPTQWLFHGRPEESTAPLQVAVARLLGYRWPAELDAEMRLSRRARALAKRCSELVSLADDDGIVCLPSVRGEEPATGRLLALLAAAGLKPAEVRELAGGTDPDEWLRNSFFAEHCKLFHERPFVWHIWDGRKRDGFHALANYHKLCEGGGKGRQLLESLTYAYLGEWIARQKDGVTRGEDGAEDRLAAAMALQKRLEAILEGEPPFDLFVRWKPLAEQPIGWEPDINDGVRVNIRPFLAKDLPSGRTGAGVLRWKPNIKWTKDRGKEPERPRAEYPWFWGWDETTEDFAGGKTFDGNRWNGCHYTNEVKQQAREPASKGGR